MPTSLKNNPINLTTFKRFWVVTDIFRCFMGRLGFWMEVINEYDILCHWVMSREHLSPGEGSF